MAKKNDELWVDYVHRYNPSKNGSCPKIDFIDWAKKNNGFVYYKITREYYKSQKESITAPPEAQEIIDKNNEETI